MLFRLIATLMLGVLGASVAFILYRHSRGVLPKAIIPFAAGLAMIAYSIWNEATWFSRTRATLPRELALVDTGPPVTSPLSPWTYVFPRIESFRVLDLRTLQPLPGAKNRFLAQVHTLGRYDPARKSSWIIDCSSGRQAEIVASTKFDASGLPSDVAWSDAGDANRIAKTACATTASAKPDK